jgi:iron transport multicopper oxidase
MYLPQVAVGFLLFATAYATTDYIGPVADLYIGNKVIQPDGFSRS